MSVLFPRLSVVRTFAQLSFLVLSCLLWSHFAQAKEVVEKKPQPIEVTLEAFKVMVDPKSGAETFVAADRINGKEVVEYRVKYRNVSNNTVEKLTAVLPIPTGVDYLPASEQPAGAFASVDGKTYAAIPLKKQIKNTKGTLVEVLVPYTEYRFLQWSVGDLLADSSKTVSARVKMSAVSVKKPKEKAK